MNLELAGYLGAAILDGTSFLVGAVPGGAGKTTVMGALLNFVPLDVALCAATEGVPGAALRAGGPRRCFICHEIGQGPYFAYLWGRDVRDFFALPSAGHMGATNLHADTIDEARETIVEGCGVGEDAFARWPLSVFLELEGTSSFRVARRVGAVWEGADRLVYRYDGATWQQVAEPRLGSPERRTRVRELLSELHDQDARRIEDVREAVVRVFSHGSIGPGGRT